MLHLISSLLFTGALMSATPSGFVSLSELCPNIKIQASYATTENFTGEIVAGYKARKALMAKAPAEALCRVQKAAEEMGYALKIFDAYRPVKAVDFFIAWAQKPETNPHIKELYYPRFTKQELFEQGYIAKRSSHSRGSAVDLTLIDSKSGRDLDMGSGFDYFDDLSHTESPKVTKEQLRNRLLLKKLMETHGFKNFSQEWWHYSFSPEPHPSEYFNFDVE